ncbi:hypothetical protein C0585_02900 [Candidatus Woesearchaeota archaeon]|nr:MAG: hypothetical protein C0585_02900 [Candidatus Woesearchaeota archaeon]
MKKENKKEGFFNKDLDKLFEKLINEKNKGLKNLDSTRNKLTKKLDIRIDELRKKRKFITEYFLLKNKTQTKKVPVRKRILSNSFIMNFRYLISIPFIYGMLLPTMIFHMFLEIYHQICFRLYKIPRVRAKDYFLFDREHLPYLNWLEKINCAYCSYFNCLIAYSREIGGRTEKYWCPIKHEIKRKDAHIHYDDFVDYSNEKDLRKKWEKLRKSND